jgi:hypothetical protein
MIRLALSLAFVLLPIGAIAQPPTSPLTEFPSEQQAQWHWPTDTVVWLNLPTGIYHFKGERWYGCTKPLREGSRRSWRPCHPKRPMKLGSVPPLGSGGHEIDLSAPAAGAHEASVPIGNGRVGAVTLRHFAGVGLDLASAVATPNH